MARKKSFDVRLRNLSTGEEHTRLIVSTDQATASEAAILKARRAGKTMAERQYGQFEVLSCEPRAA